MVVQPTASSSAQPLPATFARAQAKKAVDALLAHQAKVTDEREDTELISREEYVWLVVNTKRGTTKRKLMPKRIQLPNPPLAPPPATTVAIITKPPQRQYKDLLASPQHNIKFVNRVVDTDKLRGKWKPFEARRNLMRENDLWLADERVVPSLPKLLGKMFFEAKKQPIPINLSRKDLKAELGRAINSTYFHPSTGTSHSIRIATAGTTSAAHTLENLLAAAPIVAAQIDDGWDNILSVGIKTSTSLLLPVWTSKLDGRFDVPEPTKSDKAEKAEKATKAEKGDKKSKKRSADDSEDEVVDKKAKSSPVKPAKKATESVKKPKEAVKGKAAGKKSSSIGSGGAGKKAKEAVLGRK